VRYEIDEFEEIRTANLTRLRAAEIHTTTDLLARCGEP